MRNLKRIIAFLIVCSTVLTLAFTLVSCKENGNSNGENNIPSGNHSDYEVDERDFDSVGDDDEKFYVAMEVKKYGVVIIELEHALAPVTVKNFIKLVRDGFYNGLTFHRVVKDFMIQGGDPKADGTGGSENKIKGEFTDNGWFLNRTISHERGVISMARSKDMNSASSQFFICTADSKYLDGKYASFGRVVAGMDVVDKMTEYSLKYANAQDLISGNKQPVIKEMKVIKYK